MKAGLILVMAWFLCFMLSSQQKVALLSGGVTTIFGGVNPFESAYQAAVDGDVIYLPGGTIPFPAVINKGVKIYGAGHYPSFTAAVNKTVLNGNLSIDENADHLHLEGVELTGTGTLTFVANKKVDHVVIARCRMVNITYAGSATTPCEDNIIRECVVTGSIKMDNATSSIITNCLINGKIENANHVGISNNILFYNQNNSGGYANYVTFNNVDNCLISNNIIFRNWGGTFIFNLSDLNTFSRNVFVKAPSTTGNNTFTDNYNDVDLSSFFVLQSGVAFDYTHNYHLQNPALYLGSDGSQVGIYGGLYPYKEGAVPSNPQIISKVVSAQTNSNGELDVDITVEAQTK